MNYSSLQNIPSNWNHSTGIYTDDLIPKFRDGQEDEHYTINWYHNGINKYGEKLRNVKQPTSVFDQLTEDEFEVLLDRIKKYKNNK
jgi:hypothetical protein